MIKYGKIWISLGVAAALSAAYIWAVPACINLNSRKEFIEQKIYEKTGMNVDIGNPELSMGLFPSVWIKSGNVSVINRDNSKALSVDNIKFKLKLFPLLFKKVEIADLTANKEEAHLVFTKDKKFMLGDYPLKLNSQNNKIKFSSINLDVGPYKLILDDKLNNQKVNLSGGHFSNALYENNNAVKFSTNGTFSVNSKVTPYYADIDIKLPINKFHEDKFKISARIEDFDLSSISDYVNILSKGIIQKTGGIVNFVSTTKNSPEKHKIIISNLETDNLNIQGKDKFSRIYYKDKLSLKTNFETVDGGVKFKGTTLDAEGIHAAVNGSLLGIGGKKPIFKDLTVEVKNSRFEKIAPILPWSKDLVREVNFYALKEYTFYGDGNGKLVFNGKGRYPNTVGKVEIRNAYLIHPIKDSPKGADVDLDFKGSTMHLRVYVPVGKTQDVNVTGFAKIDGTRYSEFNIQSTKAVNMESAQEVLNPLHEIFKFKLGPIPIMKIRGTGEVSLKTRGKKIDPHLFGYVKFRNSTASFNQIHNLVFTNAYGEVNFKDTKVDFSTYGLINGLRTEITGICDVLGKLNVIAKTANQDIPKIIKVINTSPDLKDVQKVVKPFTNPKGKADLVLNIYGVAKNAEHVEFNKDVFAKGTITFHNAVTTMQDTYLPLTKISGAVNFIEKKADYKLNGYIRNSKVDVTGTANDKDIDLKAVSNNFAISDCFDLLYPDMNLPYKVDIGRLKTSFTGGYKGIVESNKIDYNKIKVHGKILSNMNTSNPIRTIGGNFTISNGTLNTTGMRGLFSGNPYNLSFTMSDIYNEKKISSAVFSFENFNIASVNSIKENIKIPAKFKKILDNISNWNGNVNIKGTIKNGRINSDTDLRNISFIYKPYDSLVHVLNGKAIIRNNNLYLDKVNSRVSSMPVFLDGYIYDILRSQNLNLYMSAKPTQMFFDRILNTKSIYPVKIKGDVSFNAQIRGTLDRLYTNSTLHVRENSYIYYMGATLAGAPTGSSGEGEVTTNPIMLVTNAVIYPGRIHINSMNYNQIISSQNFRTSVQNQLTSSGDISLVSGKVLKFNNFRIKTNSPTDARIFNVMLKKPTIKQGVFTSNLTLNGTSLSPKIIGDLNISSIDIPLFDATIRDVDINFGKDIVDLKSKGVILTNDVAFEGKFANKTTPPYIIENAVLKSDVLDLNVILNALNDFDVDKLKNGDKVGSGNSSFGEFSPEQIIVKNFDVLADSILIKKAKATEFKANIDVTPEHIAHINNYSFRLANGTVSGNAEYNLNNFKGKAVMNIQNADAGIMSDNFFDLPGQMYGNVTGNIEASCTGASSVDCLKTLSGQGNFEVKDGRMPKLGSLEYLLKAGNLITGGVTGVSINGIIDLITPLKTGNFDSIRGDIKVKDGIADEINVYSSGKDLNMYLTGSYNLLNLVANMEVYGSLSADFSSLLGLIRNLSLNKLLNTIPGIKINDINPKSTSNIYKIPNFDKSKVLRVFKAEIFGDINGYNYVKSFHWIKK